MAKRRRTFQHQWNRFMAAVLFVLGAALSPTAPSETKETRVSKAEAAQLDAAGRIGNQLSALAVKLDGSGNDGDSDPILSAPSVFAWTGTSPLRDFPTPIQPATRADRPARDGDSRAPPSA